MDPCCPFCHLTIQLVAQERRCSQLHSSLAYAIETGDQLGQARARVALTQQWPLLVHLERELESWSKCGCTCS
jgi:hypothetical protein